VLGFRVRQIRKKNNDKIYNIKKAGENKNIRRRFVCLCSQGDPEDVGCRPRGGCDLFKDYMRSLSAEVWQTRRASNCCGEVKIGEASPSSSCQLGRTDPEANWILPDTNSAQWRRNMSQPISRQLRFFLDNSVKYQLPQTGAMTFEFLLKGFQSKLHKARSSWKEGATRRVSCFVEAFFGWQLTWILDHAPACQLTQCFGTHVWVCVMSLAANQCATSDNFVYGPGISRVVERLF